MVCFEYFYLFKMRPGQIGCALCMRICIFKWMNYLCMSPHLYVNMIYCVFTSLLILNVENKDVVTFQVLHHLLHEIRYKCPPNVFCCDARKSEWCLSLMHVCHMPLAKKFSDRWWCFCKQTKNRARIILN